MIFKKSTLKKKGWKNDNFQSLAQFRILVQFELTDNGLIALLANYDTTLNVPKNGKC